MSQNDAALVDRCQRGDLAAYEELVSKYQDRVYNMAFRLTGSHADAEDMTQEAFLRVYTSLSRFRGQSAFATWLYRIVTNVCMDELRRRKRRPLAVINGSNDSEDEPVSRQIADEGPGPDELAQQREQAREVQECLKLIDPSHRIVIVLRDVEDLTYQDIAEVLSIPVGTVKSRLSRARRALREKLSERELFCGVERQ